MKIEVEEITISGEQVFKLRLNSARMTGPTSILRLLFYCLKLRITSGKKVIHNSA